MDKEKIPNSIVGDDDNFVKRMTVQLAIAKLELGGDFGRRFGDWIAISSEPIKQIFERRTAEEPDFLERCVSDVESVAKEISNELPR